MRTTFEQYLRHLQALMPQGRAWPTEDGAALTRLLAGFSGGLSRNHNRAVDLIDEADPCTTVELLTDWERVCGLPDGCRRRRGHIDGTPQCRGRQNHGAWRPIPAILYRSRVPPRIFGHHR